MKRELIITIEKDIKEKAVQNVIEQLNGFSYIDAKIVLERVSSKIGNVAKITLSEDVPEQSDKLLNIPPQGFQESQVD